MLHGAFFFLLTQKTNKTFTVKCCSICVLLMGVLNLTVIKHLRIQLFNTYKVSVFYGQFLLDISGRKHGQLAKFKTSILTINTLQKSN